MLEWTPVAELASVRRHLGIGQSAFWECAAGKALSCFYTHSSCKYILAKFASMLGSCDQYVNMWLASIPKFFTIQACWLPFIIAIFLATLRCCRTEGVCVAASSSEFFNMVRMSCHCHGISPNVENALSALALHAAE